MSTKIQHDNLRVVLVRTRNPLNMGAAARAMSNFGFLKMRVVQPYEPAFREARSAVGGTPVLAKAEAFESVADAVADCTLVVGTTAARSRGQAHTMRTLDDGAKLIRKHLQSGRVAVLFGSEKRGLSNEDMSHCDWLMHIPTREEHLSMNLGQAVAVTLYEVSRGSKQLPAPAKSNAAKAAELERMTQVLLNVMRESGYLDRSAAKAEEKMRRFVRGLKLNGEDCELLLGMMRQVAWKLKTKGSDQ